MSGRRVALAPRAKADLEAIAVWIAERGGQLCALEYVQRIRRYLTGFDHFPECDSRHDDIQPGLRTVGFERRVTIAFIVLADRVEIQRVFYGVQDWARALKGESPDD